MRESGNKMAETIRQTIEDPMSIFVETKLQQREEKYARVDHLKVGTWGTLLSSSFCHCFILHYIKVENIAVPVLLVRNSVLTFIFAFFILYDLFLSGTNGRNKSRGGGTPQKKTSESEPR